MKKLVSVLIPCFNEEEALPYLYRALTDIVDSLPDYQWELLFVNDGSDDNTMPIIHDLFDRDQRVSYINLSRNFGKEKAMLAGFDYVTGDCTIVMDADLQDPPELIKEMLKYWECGFEDVYAKRKDRGNESWLRKKFSMLFYHLLEKSTKFEVLKNVGDFRLLDKKCVQALRKIREGERYTKGLFCWIGYKKKELLFDRHSREHGNTHWNFLQLLGLAIEGFTSFTVAPLRFATLIGLVTAFFTLIYLLWTLIKVAIWGDPVAGFPTLISVVLFLGAVQLISIGILGEYVGRIFNETKHRPVYLVDEYKSHLMSD
jgi:glycosyltransferase involved in cell wall biosynthesis